MSPERLASHNAVKTEFTRALATLIKQTGAGRFFSDGTLLSNERAELSTEPDGVYVAFDTVSRGRVCLTPTADGDDAAEITGSPDLVFEIISPSSLHKDAVELRRKYHRSGVTEYWLIDARGEEIDFQILRREARDFEGVVAGRNGWLTSPVLGRKFHLTRKLDQIGLWDYTLHVRR